MAKKKKELTPQEAVTAIMADERVIYFGIRHFSPVCAKQVAALIRAVRPMGVMVEGPSDASELIPWIVHPDTVPPIAVLSTFVDRKNLFGLNGTLSSSEQVPTRYRGWWPFTVYSPEYQALKAGQEVGAKLAFCDVPLSGTIEYTHVRPRKVSTTSDDEALAVDPYIDALCRNQRRRNFAEFWDANFEAAGHALSPTEFQRNVLTLAWCARNLGPPSDELPPEEIDREDDGIAVREAHMAFEIDRFLKDCVAGGAPAEGKLLVVVGAYHAAMLPSTKKKKAPAKVDKNLETLVTGTSHAALSKLYEMTLLPQWNEVAWERIVASDPTPFDSTALRLIIEIMRQARTQGEGLSTADAVGGYKVAKVLGELRNNRECTVMDLLDAVKMSYVKGDEVLRGGEVEAACKSVLVGTGLGRVTAEAGQAPLLRDYYERCRDLSIEISGEAKTVRCDVHKQEKHRLKSAFLHQADFLAIPMFSDLDKDDAKAGWNRRVLALKKPTGHYKGPDLQTGENLHLITETWGIQWTDAVDERLLELTDRGASVAAVAKTLLEEKLEAARGKASDASKLLLTSAQMMLLDLFDPILDVVEDALVVDSSFVSLTGALSDFVVLHGYRDALATKGHGRLLGTVRALHNQAVLVLPQLARTDAEHTEEALDHLQTLVRIALTFEVAGEDPLDRVLLLERLRQLVSIPDARPAIRGACFGVLYSLGAAREKEVAAELSGYLLGSADSVLESGPFIDGLFRTSKSIFMGNPRLLRAVNRVLEALDWETFKVILPDLRRAFTQFIPAEIDAISVLVAEEIGIDDAPPSDLPVPATVSRLTAAADARVATRLKEWV
jgi:hypothetical protein